MARITIIGGGSYHWVPRILADFVNTPSLQASEVVLHDIDRDRLPRMVDLGTQFAAVRGVPLSVQAAEERRAALDGADYVVTAFSVGGFDSMRHDLEIPERHGLRQPVGDSVGPGGVMRALRSIPVLLAMARDIEEICPDAWLLNVTNPLTALCRAVTAGTAVKTVGLCNEWIGTQFVLSLLFDTGMHEIDPVIAGVNHLPLVTELRVGERDGFALLRDLLDHPDEAATAPLWMDPPEGLRYQKVAPGDTWTKADVIANNPLRFELFQRLGVLPGSTDHHVAEFFPGFVSEQNDFGAAWRIRIQGLAGHRADAAGDIAVYEAMRDAPEVPTLPSGEIVAPVLDGLVSGEARNLPVNIPNGGHVANLPDGAVVEVIGTVDGDGVRGRDLAWVPSVLGEFLRRVSVAQELTVEAALSGDRTKVFEAMLADPLAGRLPYERVRAMAEEMLAASAPWLPQFT